jgi:hypothetical protein
MLIAFWLALSGQVEAASISLAWDAPPEQVDGYTIHYGTQSGVYTQSVDVGSVTTYAVSGLVIGQVYYFRVAAYNSAGTSPLSNEASGTVALSSFTDDPLLSGVTMVKAVHLEELRTRVNAVRIAHGLGTFSFTDPVLVPGVTEARAAHLAELRQALNEAYAAAGQAPPPYTDPLIPAESVVIRPPHVSELRAAVVALE